MSTFIRCPHCAKCIGKYYDFFQLAREAYNSDQIDKQYTDYDPEKIIFNPSITPSLEEIFDALGLANRCCRMHLVTVERFDKMYK
jgi:hypothetical protein